MIILHEEERVLFCLRRFECFSSCLFNCLMFVLSFICLFRLWIVIYLCFIDHEMRNVNKFANDYDFLICCCSYIIIFGISIWLFLIEKLFSWYSIVLCWITNFICAISILIIDKRQWLSKKKKRISQLMMDTMKRKN